MFGVIWGSFGGEIASEDYPVEEGVVCALVDMATRQRADDDDNEADGPAPNASISNRHKMFSRRQCERMTLAAHTIRGQSSSRILKRLALPVRENPHTTYAARCPEEQKYLLPFCASEKEQMEQDLAGTDGE